MNDKSIITNRMKQILTLISDGKTASDISKELSLSEKTIEITLKKIRNKLQAKNTPHAVYIALKNGIIEL